MAQSFSPKKYFQKIHAHELLADFYEKFSITAILGITDSTARKNAVGSMMEFYKSLTPSQRIDIEKEFVLINLLSTKHSIPLFTSILKEKKLPHEETNVECKTIEDKVLYYYLNHKDVFDEVLFFHDFYVSKGYMLYEANTVDLTKAMFSVTELTKEFKRIANKDERVTDCDVTAKVLDNLLYVHALFEGTPEIQPRRDTVTGEFDRSRTVKKQEEVKIVYFPEDKEVLISYTGNKHERLVFLDTFLRIVCDCGFEDKIQSFDINTFKNRDFDFSKTNKGIPLLNWKIKGITLSFGNEKAKKKIKLSLPSTASENGLGPMFSVLDELTLTKQFELYIIENISLGFYFIDSKKADKSITVSCSLSPNKSSLCPLFPHDRHTRTLLKQAGIDHGFIEQVQKDTEKVAKKWE